MLLAGDAGRLLGLILFGFFVAVAGVYYVSAPR